MGFRNEHAFCMKVKGKAFEMKRQDLWDQTYPLCSLIL